MAQVKVMLHGALRAYSPQGEVPVEVELEDGQTIEEILGVLGIPRRSVSFAAVNGAKCSWQTLPEDGDKVAFFSPFSGG